jgi:hypothetical protein
MTNGRTDTTVPLANAEFLDQRLPNSRLAIIDARHVIAPAFEHDLVCPLRRAEADNS